MDTQKMVDEINKIVDTAVDWWSNAIASKGDVHPERMERFRQVLSTRLSTELAVEGSATLQTDIYPEELLAEVALSSQLWGKAFPEQTQMAVSQKEVTLNRNGKLEVLYQTKNPEPTQDKS